MSTNKENKVDLLFAEAIKKTRNKAGISQPIFGEKFGISKGYVQMLESGKRSPSQSLRREIERWMAEECDAFGEVAGTSPKKAITELVTEREKFDQDLDGLFSIIKRWQEDEHDADSLTSMRFIQFFHERIPELGEWIKKQKGAIADNGPQENLSAAGGKS